MEFDWMHYELPADIVERNAAQRVATNVAETRDRAGLMRRLGYDRAYAKHRLLGNQLEACELMPGRPALAAKRLRGEVDWAYDR